MESAAGEADEQITTRFMLVMYQSGNDAISHFLANQIRDLLEEIDSPKESTEIDLWLDTPGGDAHAAYKIGILLRSCADHIRVVIPDYAKSAGTLLALVADEIYMAPAAELGPLDAQIQYEQEGVSISALDRGKPLDDLAAAALSLALNGGATVLQHTRLSRQEAITAMLNFSAQFMAPMVSKLDPTMLHWSKSLLEVAVEYGQRLLATRKEKPTQQLQQLPRKLVEEYPTHGFVICRDEARELGLPVRDLSDYDFAAPAMAIHRASEDNRESVLTLMPVTGLTGGPSEEGAKDEEQDQA